MDFLAHRRDPGKLKVGVVLQFSELRNRFFRDGVDNTAAIFFNVDARARPLRTGSNLVSLDTHHVVEGLQGDAAGLSWGDEAGRTSQEGSRTCFRCQPLW